MILTTTYTFLQLSFVLIHIGASLGCIDLSTNRGSSFISSRPLSPQQQGNTIFRAGPVIASNLNPAFFKKSLTTSFFQERRRSIVRMRGGSNSANSPSSQQLRYRSVLAQDIPVCYDIESASYPSDEAASKESLEYRQRHAEPYFRCAVLVPEKDKEEEIIIGFVCSTRCDSFEEESMSKHDPSGKLLAIHSVVIQEEYRRKGFATEMLKDYVSAIKKLNDTGIEKIVMIAKSHLLGFYVKCGFTVTKLSPIVHGKDPWYELEMILNQSGENDASVRSAPLEDESWFVKTEQFSKPFSVVKPYLELRRAWVNELRASGYCITSGYHVDSEGEPSEGGMMFLAAKNYTEALKIVRQDPLVANDCVEWKLNSWIPEVGNVRLL